MFGNVICILLSFARDLAKQENTTQFDSGSKTAITQSVLHGLAWYFLCVKANVLVRCWAHQNGPIV
jgi:hypothetical protein